MLVVVVVVVVAAGGGVVGRRGGAVYLQSWEAAGGAPKFNPPGRFKPHTPENPSSAKSDPKQRNLNQPLRPKPKTLNS